MFKILKLMAPNFFYCAVLLCVSSVSAQPDNSKQEILLYGEKPMPYNKPHELVEYEAVCWGARCVYQVVTPTLTLFKPKHNTSKAAVVILPGGGYETEAVYHEGFDIAKKLAHEGITAAVLKYRLPNPRTSSHPHLVPITDVRAALRWLRRHHKSLNLALDRIGVMGFSAGSHLATVASVNPSSNSVENPDFSLLIYGVTRLNEENKKWLEESLFHRPMTEEEIAQNTLLERISSSTPPAFLVHALDDDVCHYSESTLYAEALKANKVHVELHLFATGGHGFGAGHQRHGTDQWLPLAANWIKRIIEK